MLIFTLVLNNLEGHDIFMFTIDLCYKVSESLHQINLLLQVSFDRNNCYLAKHYVIYCYMCIFRMEKNGLVPNPDAEPLSHEMSI